jgi:hypothetical protein
MEPMRRYRFVKTNGQSHKPDLHAHFQIIVWPAPNFLFATPRGYFIFSQSIKKKWRKP